jgi:hypothetical protein
MSDQELYRRAVQAHYRWCERNNVVPQQPSWGLSDVVHVGGGDERVELANVNGPLASYRYSPATSRLKRLVQSASTP